MIHFVLALAVLGGQTSKVHCHNVPCDPDAVACPALAVCDSSLLAFNLAAPLPILNGQTSTTPPANVLTWADSNTAGTVTWNVYRGSIGCSATPGAFAVIKSGLTVMTYTDGNLQPGTLYSYYSTAVRTADSSESSPSNCITMTAPPPTPPNAPTGLKFGTK